MSSSHNFETRKPHASLDSIRRSVKARKIQAIIGHERLGQARCVLEIGCGSGIISRAIAQSIHPAGTLYAIDVTDSRTVFDGYRFQQVENTCLPFEDEYFDIIISNHVIEHVGDTAAQLHHLTEMKRTLAPGGVIYLAFPNKWRILEPHFLLPLLSWLPQSLADFYVRSTKKGSYYDCRLLSLIQSKQLMAKAGLKASNQTHSAFRQALVIEHSGNWALKLAADILPDWLLRCAMPAMPTYIFILEDELGHPIKPGCP